MAGARPTTCRPGWWSMSEDRKRNFMTPRFGAVECRYFGRDFTADMALLRALIAVDPQPTRAALSREHCRRIGWFKPDGGLKDMMARVTMLAMHRDGLIVLPPPKGRSVPAKADRLRTRHRAAAVPGPEPSTTSARSLCAPSCATPARASAGTMLPLSRLQDPGRRPDALRRPRPQRLGARHARLLHRRVEASPRATTSSDGRRECAEQPPPRRRQPQVPSCPGSPSPIGSHILASCAAVCPRTGPSATTPPPCFETFVETRYTGASTASGWIHVTTGTRNAPSRERQRITDPDYPRI